MLRRFAKQTLQKLRSTDYQTLNWIELSRSRTLHNVSEIQKLHQDWEVIPVLKGNAYGHGLEEMAEILNGADCHFVAVDGYFEAAKIRDITHHRILVMGYILPENMHLLDIKHCSFVVQDIAGLRAFGSLKKPVNIHMELNTGFNRLGLQADEIEEYLRELKKHTNLRLEGIMTHLADADNPDDDAFTRRQVEQFDYLVENILKEGFKPSLIHIAQTAGSTKAASRFANALRLGIGLYGINPLEPGDPHYHELANLQPVLTLKSHIIKVIDLKKGDRVSYNGTFAAPKSMRIGVLPLGYYEGIPRELSNKGYVIAGSKVLPIVGRVCMNHTMAAITNKIEMGDEVMIISDNPAHPNSVAQLHLQYGLFHYQVLTSISSSVRRQIVA